MQLWDFFPTISPLFPRIKFKIVNLMNFGAES